MTLSRILLVTGTDTGVGKTIATAALASMLLEHGKTVAVYKPCQSGAAEGDSDIAEIQRLSGVEQAEAGVVLSLPMAPVPAAELDGVTLPTVHAHAERILAYAERFDYVLVEGAGGLLVELDGERNTLAELAIAVGPEAAMVVVARAALGTLNHTALTLEALARREIAVQALVLGSWPQDPGLIETTNHEHFAARDIPLCDIPEDAALLTPVQFRSAASGWLDGLV
ncbi:MAG TPA: dethiobiotin synthase [Pseudolysinimonas sp.]|nr:dethiobiotin synthase [Pseudolysinimonas sp.]